MALNDKKVQLKIITPNGIFWNEPVNIVTLKTTEGFIGLQKNRMPFVAALDIDKLFINSKNTPNYHKCAIAGGIVFVSKEEITIITDAIEFAEKIDLGRARKAQAWAEDQVKKTTPNMSEHIQAELALEKAINRIRVRTQI